MTDETATFSRTIPPTYNPLQVAADLTFSEVSVLSNLRVWIPLSLFAILSFAPKASYAQQSPPPPTPSHTQLPTPDTGDETANNMSAEMAKKANAVLAIDNAMCSPALQQPIAFGADLVVHSATKYIDGQGRVLAGAIAGRSDLVTGPLFLIEIGGAGVLAWIDPPLLLLGLPLLALQLMRVTATFGLRRAGRTAG